MTEPELLCFILACYGLTTILVWGRIFKGIRPEHEFFHCAHCVGFWVGCLMSFAFAFTAGFAVNMALSGFISAGSCYILNSLFGDSGMNLNINRTKE